MRGSKASSLELQKTIQELCRRASIVASSERLIDELRCISRTACKNPEAQADYLHNVLRELSLPCKFASVYYCRILVLEGHPSCEASDKTVPGSCALINFFAATSRPPRYTCLPRYSAHAAREGTHEDSRTKFDYALMYFESEREHVVSDLRMAPKAAFT